MFILEVKNLTKVFAGHTVVDHLSFSLKEGEILGILGPNGAGKTTTMQMVLGILTPTGGSVTAFGKDLAKNRSEAAEFMNFSSTYTDLPWRLTVRENSTWASHMYQIADRGKRLAKLREIFRLDKLWNKPISALSAGQKTRVNLAKACVNFPRILILDEPTASLDPEVAELIHAFLKKERGQFKTSIILTSHNMSEVEDLCDRVLVLKNGQIIAEDTPLGLTRRIKNCHLTLRLKTPANKTREIIKPLKLAHYLGKSSLKITLPEIEVAAVISTLTKKGLEYSEIAISRPTLQDFFLEVAREKEVK